MKAARKPATSGDGPSGGGLMTQVVPVLRF